MPEQPQTPDEWADLLRRNWSERSQSSQREKYVAPLPPDAESGTWERQAVVDTETMLWGYDPGRIADWEVLEVGCGVGRMVSPMLARVGRYTGFDIAAGMVDEARSKLDGEPRARFFVSDGLGVPEGARDRSYDLVFSHGVLIHCPLDVIRSLLTSAFDSVAPGGELRFQLLADIDDHEGIVSVEAAAADIQTAQSIDRVEEAAEPDPLIDGRYYMGHAFRYAEVEPLLNGLGAASVQVVRPTPMHIYGIVARAGA